MKNTNAVGLALDHCQAWSNHDWDKARKALADDVKVTAMTTMPCAPKTDLDGPDAYMDGLRAFAGTVVPGTLQIDATAGDERNALLQLTVHTAGLPSDRLLCMALACISSTRTTNQGRADRLRRHATLKPWRGRVG
jgi:hypothetical protein